MAVAGRIGKVSLTFHDSNGKIVALMLSALLEQDEMTHDQLLTLTADLPAAIAALVTMIEGGLVETFVDTISGSPMWVHHLTPRGESVAFQLM